MLRFIAFCEEERQVGEVYQDIRDPLGVEHPDASFVILRQADQREWEKCLTAFGLDAASWSELLGSLGLPEVYFYEVELLD